MATTYGTCALCGYRTNKAGMTRHLESCLPKHDKASAKAARLWQLRVESEDSPLYFLDLEAKEDATLSQLDAFLRDIWLECCGHLSMFEIAGVHYTVDYADDDDILGGAFGDEKSMKVKLGEVLSVGESFRHEYDFGSTTYLKLRVLGERVGKIGAERVRLVARNEAPQFGCRVCGAVATQLNVEEYDSDNPFYCDAHADEEDWAFLPVVNSPRMGVCGYTGEGSQ